MKTCNRCNTAKSVNDFNPSQKYCRECNKEYQKSHYAKNKELYNEKRKQYQIKTLKFINDYLKTHPCIVCGESRVPALQFDHIDTNNKLFTISQARDKSIESVKTEIKKCQILCANCHAVKTAEQFQWYKNY